MATRNSSSSYKFQTWVILHCRKRIMSGGSWLSHSAQPRYVPTYQWGYGGGSVNQGLRFLSSSSRVQGQTKLEILKRFDQVQPPLPAPAPMFGFGFSNWVKWLLGSLLSLVLPFWEKNWYNLLKLEGKAENAVKEVEEVAEVVAMVATTADKALTKVANQLPDESKLKEVVQEMENFSRVAVQDSQLIQNLMHKVGDIKQDLEDVETIIEPVVHKIIQTKDQ